MLIGKIGGKGNGKYTRDIIFIYIYLLDTFDPFGTCTLST